METITEPQKTSKFSKKIIAAVSAVCIIVGALGWYFLYFTKTPAYSLNIIRESIQNHDLEKFKKHVDLDSVLSRGYDDLIVVTLEKDASLNGEQRKMIAGFAQMFKGAVVPGIKDGIFRYVETGSWDAQAKGEDGAAKKNAVVNTEQMANQTRLKDSAFKEIAYTKKENANATVGIRLYDEKTKKEAVLDIKMRRLSDDTWQIAEIANLKEYLNAIDANAAADQSSDHKK